MPLQMVAVVHVMLIFSLQRNLLMVSAFDSKQLLSRSMLEWNLIVPPISIERRKTNCLEPVSKRRGFQISSFISDGDMEQDLLSYLPNRGQDIPPDFLQLIRGATTRYSHPSSFREGDNLGGISHIMDVINFEYKVSSKWPITIQKVTYTDQQILTRLLSVCLFHKLPAPIVCELLKEYDIRNEENSASKNDTKLEEGDNFRTCLQAMKADGWKAIAFPEGIRVQVRPGQVCPTWKDDLPPRKVTREMADTLIEKAHVANTPPPPISLPSATLKAANTSGSKLKQRSCKKTAMEPELALPTSPGARMAIPFFPRDRVTVASKIQARITRAFSKVRSKTQKLSEKLNQAGRSGFLAYGFLNLALYAGGTLLQWHRIAIAGPPTISSQVQKLGKVLGTVYVGSQVTKLPRIALAVALAPVGNRSLDWLQEKLGISEGTAFGILTATLIGSFLAVVGSLIVGSALLA